MVLIIKGAEMVKVATTTAYPMNGGGANSGYSIRATKELKKGQVVEVGAGRPLKGFLGKVPNIEALQSWQLFSMMKSYVKPRGDCHLDEEAPWNKKAKLDKIITSILTQV